MKKSRKHRESSDLSDEDHPAHKYSRHTGHHHDKYLTDSITSHSRSSVDDRRTYHKHSRHPRHLRDKGSPDNMTWRDRPSAEDYSVHKYSKHSANNHGNNPTVDKTPHSGSLDYHSKHNYQKNEDAESNSSDEVLIRYRASRRRPRGSGQDDIARQIKNIEKAQREALRPLSAESQEIHIRYVPVITRSTSPPQVSRDNTRLVSPAAPKSHEYEPTLRKSKSQGVSASDVTNQLKDLTVSWFTKRSSQEHAHKSTSSRRNKHERREKHGKKKGLLTSKFLAPLAQRWICYKCGKVRSDAIHDRHPLQAGQKMQPNWCGKCRVNGELKGRPLDWNGQRHYCWGCGIVRSEKYHEENPVTKGERSTPNYCKRCRELSPSFERNLREASEIGSEISVRDKAFRQQVYDADLSEIEENEDYQDTSAPGKENENPNRLKKQRATKSFIFENGSSRTKTVSDSSSEGGVPITMLKAMHLDAERARNASSEGGGFHLPAASYNPPPVECTSVVDEDGDLEMKDAGVMTGSGTALDSSTHAFMSKGCQTELDSPAIFVPIQRAATTTTTTRKKVRWSEDSSRPTTADSSQSCTHPYQSDSGFSSSGQRSDVSMKSTGSSRGWLRRPHPAKVSTGSPPERNGTNIEVNSSDGTRWGEEQVSAAQWNSNFGQDLPSQGTFGNVGSFDMSDTPAYFSGPSQSGYRYQMPPTPPGSLKMGDGNTGYGRDYQNGSSSWNHSPDQEIPNFSRPYQSPSKPHTKNSSAYNVHSGPGYISSPGYGTRMNYGYFNQQQSYPAFSSAAHFSDSATYRDFSGHAAPTEDLPYQYNTTTSPSPASSSSSSSGKGYTYTSCKQKNGGGGGNDDDYFFPDFPAPPGCPAFDFSHLKETSATHNMDFYTHVPDEGAAVAGGTKFVRMKNQAQGGSTPDRSRSYHQKQQQHWHLYEDDDNGEGEVEMEREERESCEWRDGQTTVHRSGGGGGGPMSSSSYSVNLGNSNNNNTTHTNTVTILSIREITSDEDLSGDDGGEKDDDDHDVDDISDLATVIQSGTKSICEA